MRKYRVHELGKFRYSDIGEYVDEDHTDRPLRNDELVDLLNNKEHTINEMIKTIRIYDDAYIDLNKKYKKVVDENEQLKKKILEEIDLEVAYVNETYSDGRMSKEQHDGAIITLRQLREKFE